MMIEMLTLIVGPMKSGKSLELIARMAPYEYTDKRILYIQPRLNTRESKIKSRLGLGADTIQVRSLTEVAEYFDVIGIDEINMLSVADAEVVSDWLKQKKQVIACGLDLDYRGIMFPIVERLLELKPEKLVSKKAVCDVCKKYRALFTQILEDNEPLLEGLPIITIDDGRYEFQARCRHCFESLPRIKEIASE